MNLYLVLLGRSVWASLNTFYSVLVEGQFTPDVVMIVCEDSFEENLIQLDEGFRVISKGFGLDPEIRSISVEEGNIVSAGLEIRGIIDSFSHEATVALDITSGRKALVAGALLSTSDRQPGHVFYLIIDTLEDVAKPFPMIPYQVQHLVDLREQIRRYQVG